MVVCNIQRKMLSDTKFDNELYCGAAGILEKEKCVYNESEGGVDDNDIVATHALFELLLK